MAEPANQTPQLPDHLPVLPLRQTVVFPMTVQPLAVNRPVSTESVNRALATDRMVLLVMQTGDQEDPTPDDLRKIGTAGVVRQMAKGPAGLQILVEGLTRVRVTGVTREGNLMRATVETAPEPVGAHDRDRRVSPPRPRARRQGGVAGEWHLARAPLAHRQHRRPAATHLSPRAASST